MTWHEIGDNAIGDCNVALWLTAILPKKMFVLEFLYALLDFVICIVSFLLTNYLKIKAFDEWKKELVLKLK